MAKARQLFKGSTYLITRRCTQRLFLTLPSQLINQVLSFCMLRAALMYNIQLHAFCFMSNHYHLVLTDPEKKLPRFEEWLNKFSSKCINFYRHRQQNNWDNRPYSAVRLREEFPEDLFDSKEELISREEILDKIVYTLVNPVQAGLVDHGYKWPGVWSAPALMSSGYIEAKRPSYFSKKGPVPEKVRMKLSLPPGFEDMSPEEFSGLVQERVKERERGIQKEFKDKGRSFMGVKKIKALSSCEESQTMKPDTPEPVGELNPQIACKNKRRRIELLERLRIFYHEYRMAWKRFCNGERDVLFPAGTYKMQVLYNVKCCPEPT